VLAKMLVRRTPEAASPTAPSVRARRRHRRAGDPGIDLRRLMMRAIRTAG